MIYEQPLRLEPAASPRRKPRPMFLPGLAAAVLAGSGFGLMSRSQLPIPDLSPTPATALEGVKIVPAPLASAPPGAAAPLDQAATVPAVASTGEPPARGPAPISASFRPAGDPSFDCGQALSAAEVLICSDPRLAAADRRMIKALRGALDAGAPAWRLRRDQRDWLDARDATAREAPDQVAGLYQQRIEELEADARGLSPARW